jgi:hypothetical protein
MSRVVLVVVVVTAAPVVVGAAADSPDVQDAARSAGADVTDRTAWYRRPVA